MITRDKNTYDVLGAALEGQSYQFFVDSLYAEKYNAPQFGKLFSWGIPGIDLTYEQMEATVSLYPMASVVDYGSPAPLRGTQGATLSTGSVPRMKHGFVINEKEIRTQMLLLQRGANINIPAMQEILFNSTDQLIGGNYNRLNHMAYEALSTGKYVLNSTSNPDGIPLEFDFKVPAANKKKAGGFGSIGRKAAWSDTTNSNPIGDLQDMVKYAKNNFKPYGIFSMSDGTWQKFIAHPKVREQVLLSLRFENAATIAATYPLLEDQVITFLRGLKLPPIEVVDVIAAAEKYNKATKKLEWTPTYPFVDDVVVLRPAGLIGEIKCAEPVVVPDPASRFAYFDGGRTVLKQFFDGRANTQSIESELTALPVLSMPKSLLYLDTAHAAD